MRNLLLAGVASIGLLSSHTAIAMDDSPWSVRAGITKIDTEAEDSRTDAGGVRELDSTGFSFNVNYALNRNWEVDVLLALPFEHDIEVNGDAIASTRHLPPTVSMKYRFMPGETIDVYAGLGLNYTIFFEEDIDGGELELEPSFGLAGMLGVDYHVSDQWALGADVRYIQIETDAKVNGTDIGTVQIDPWVFSLNIVRKF